MYTLWHHSCDTDDWTCIHYENTHVTQMYEHVYIVTPLMWHRWLNMYTLWQHSRNTDAWTCIHYDTTHVTQMTEHVYIMTTLMECECAGARSMAHNFVSRKISGVLPSKCWCKAPKLHVDMCQAIRNAGTKNWNDTMRVWCQYSEKLWWVDPEFPPKVTLRWTRSALVQRNQLTSHFGPKALLNWINPSAGQTEPPDQHAPQN